MNTLGTAPFCPWSIKPAMLNNKSMTWPCSIQIYLCTLKFGFMLFLCVTNILFTFWTFKNVKPILHSQNVQKQAGGQVWLVGPSWPRVLAPRVWGGVSPRALPTRLCPLHCLFPFFFSSIPQLFLTRGFLKQ